MNCSQFQELGNSQSLLSNTSCATKSFRHDNHNNCDIIIDDNDNKNNPLKCSSLQNNFWVLENTWYMVSPSMYWRWSARWCASLHANQSPYRQKWIFKDPLFVIEYMRKAKHSNSLSLCSIMLFFVFTWGWLKEHICETLLHWWFQ